MTRCQRVFGYAIAVIGCVLVLLFRLAMSETLQKEAVLSPFVLPVLAAAWCGGFRPGMFATLLSMGCAIVFVLSPDMSLSIATMADGFVVGIFAVTGTTISLLFDALYEARRRETEKQFRRLADSMPQIVWIAQANGRSVWFNQRWHEYTGTSPDHVGKSPVRPFHDPAVITFRDNGQGIQPDMLDAVFEPFRQIKNTRQCSGGGLGIGLWLARQLVELQGGTILAHSEGPAKGSEFVVMLPAIAEPRPLDALSGTPQPEQQRDDIPSHRILIVDDVKESAQTLAKLLRSLGQDSTPLYDGQAGLDWIVANHPDVVFLDIAMPKLDGYEVARRVRQHPEMQDVALIALTGYGQHADQQRAYDAGFDFHLTKPANIPILKDLLRKLPTAGSVSETATHRSSPSSRNSHAMNAEGP